MNWHERYIRQAAWTRELRTYLFERCGWSTARCVLEVGCGTGAVLTELMMPGPALHGVDLERSSLRECREHAPAAHLVCADARSLPYADQAFGVTFCHFVLLWIREPLQALQEMRRVTASAGYVLALAEPDYGARVDQPAELEWLGQRQNEALQKAGVALRRGAELGDLFQRAGIHLIETGAIRSTHAQALQKDEWESEWKVLEADLEGSVSPKEMARIKAVDRQARASGKHMLNVPTYFAWGQV
jgi:SAM-dependent methyltransferase